MSSIATVLKKNSLDVLSFAKIKHFAHLFGFEYLEDSQANIVTKTVLLETKNTRSY